MSGTQIQKEIETAMEEEFERLLTEFSSNPLVAILASGGTLMDLTTDNILDMLEG